MAAMIEMLNVVCTRRSCAKFYLNMTSLSISVTCLYIKKLLLTCMSGGLAQMVERSLSMREVPGSMPGFSNSNFSFSLNFIH